MATVDIYLEADFGTANTGLDTVGYALDNTDGSSYAARTTTGVSEAFAGSGVYSVLATVDDSFQGSVVWDTGGDTPLYAYDQVNSTTSVPGGITAASMTDSATGSEVCSVKTTTSMTDSAAGSEACSMRTVTAAYIPHWS